MFKLPTGVVINNLIDDLRIFSWEASEILINYSQILKDPKGSKKMGMAGRDAVFAKYSNEKLAKSLINNILAPTISTS